ncbi:MAG: hypothetical protein IKN71_08175 [Alphaproteobacteria bacterium]|nr:hypothetical protein [Alphaproteobacteria bacterium]
MEKINFRTHDWENARKILDFFKQETTCLDSRGLLCAEPKYVVAMDDDMVSAFYAATIMSYAKRQFGKYPKLLCVGGTGMLSKYMNKLDDGTFLSEGMKLRMTALKFDNFPVSVLDKGNNTGANLKEIIDYLASQHACDAPVVFCLTQRLSKRVERTVAFTTYQFPGTHPLNAYYYVPEERLEDMCQLYNGKAIADGLPLLSEVAALFDRVGLDRYAGRYMAPFDKVVPKDVLLAGQQLLDKYPIRVSRTPLSAPLQFAKMYFGVLRHRKDIADDLEQKIVLWKRQY